MQNIWNHIEQMGRGYGVDPLVFAVLYLLHHPLFWGTMAWLAQRVRARRPILFQAVLGTFFWVMPYLYVLVFGRGLPAWVYLAVAIFLAIGGYHAIDQARKRIAASKAAANAAEPERVQS